MKIEVEIECCCQEMLDYITARGIQRLCGDDRIEHCMFCGDIITKTLKYELDI